MAIEPMINDKCSGYTLLELLTVLVIIGIMVTGTAIAWYGGSGRNLDCLPVMRALDEMNAIQDAIVKGVYPDLEYIPCRKDSLFTTSYLCFEYDQVEIDGVKAWNKYYSKGWRGPYIEPNATVDATYFDPESYPCDAEGNPVSLPVIATPWADKCEKDAIEAEEGGDDVEAEKLRRGKYYQILKPIWTRDRWEIYKDAASIVCRGEDCLPGLAEELLNKCTESCAENCDVEGTCKPKCDAICTENMGSARAMCLEQCNARCYKEVSYECIAPCYSKCVSALKIADPDDDEYIDIGDDIVMFVFSGGLRSPLDE